MWEGWSERGEGGSTLKTAPHDLPHLFCLCAVYLACVQLVGKQSIPVEGDGMNERNEGSF